MKNAKGMDKTSSSAMRMNSASAVKFVSGAACPEIPCIRVGKRHSLLMLVLATSCFLAACGGGSGDTDTDVGTESVNTGVDAENTGTPGSSVQNDSDNADTETNTDTLMDTSSANTDDTETGEQNSEQSTDQNNVDSTSDEDALQPSGNENNTDDNSEDNTDGDDADVTLGVTAVVPVAWDEMTVTGTTSGTVLAIENLKTTNAGSIVFTGRVNPENQNPVYAKQQILAGKVGSPPKVVIGIGDEINADRAGFKLSLPGHIDIASDGTVALTASVRRESPGSLLSTEESQALIVVQGGVTETLLMMNDKVDSPRGEVELRGFERVSVSAAGIAFTGRTTGAGSPTGLFVEQENGFKSLVEDGNGASREIALSVDGCRVEYSSPQQFRLLDDGALVFSATIDGGFVGSACDRDEDAIMHYKDGTLEVIAREGDLVEGNENYEFGKPSLVEILDDGRVIVSSTIVDKAGSFALADWTSRHSVWLMSKDAAPVLILQEGESISRSTGKSVMDFGNIDTGDNTKYQTLYSVDTSGQIAMRVYERGFSPTIERVSIHRAKISSLAKESVEINNPGDAGFQFLDEAFANQDLTGTQLTSSLDITDILPPFSATDRLLSINNFTVDSVGNIYFSAVVMDSVTFDEKGNYIFRRDANGQLSVIASPLDRVRVDGRDELIFSSFLVNQFGSFAGADKLQLMIIPGDKLVVSTGYAVLLFDQN